ncbi:hypothetical protein OG455_05360 [Kitasatospora sp. NBC_01287]|uniref:hypothetical protein n=1 Tax=Kitasatospora sp. NBC_01287 TaxID=2903573 RepID=UPI0022506BA1|nr:hypothetical protein [Kitasatospora sp. NBC_01287]MCX4744955.1 hypothetical protein [Kitasatospora sp. NBC_01287]
MKRSEPDPLDRRGLLAAAGAVAAGGVTTALAGALGAGRAAGAEPGDAGGTDAAGRGGATAGGGAPEPAAFGPASVRPGDPRYDSLLRGDNFRFVGRPDEIRVVGSTARVVRAVEDAVRMNRGTWPPAATRRRPATCAAPSPTPNSPPCTGT